MLESFLKLHPALLNVAIEATNDCNMDCSYCTRKHRAIGYMSMDLFRQIIKQIPFYTRVGLSYGGESILHPDFNEMVKLCQGKFRELNVYSNGLRQYPAGIKVVVGKKPPKYIVTADFKFAEKYDLPKPRLASVNLRTGRIRLPRKFCRSLYNYMAILWNGDVTLCCSDIAGLKVIGNVKKQSLMSIWKSTAYRDLRKTGYCVGCEIYPYMPNMEEKIAELARKQSRHIERDLIGPIAF